MEEPKDGELVTAQEAQTRDDLKKLEDDIRAEVTAAEEKEAAEKFHVVKNPGDRQGLTWPVGIVVYLTYEEMHKAFKDPWVWGATVLGPAYKGKMVTEWAFVGGDREWSLNTTWPTGKELPKDKKQDWFLKGTGTDYDEFATWLAGRLGRPLPVICDDDDCTPPKVKGAANVFGMDTPEPVQP